MLFKIIYDGEHICITFGFRVDDHMLCSVMIFFFFHIDFQTSRYFTMCIMFCVYALRKLTNRAQHKLFYLQDLSVTTREDVQLLCVYYTIKTICFGVKKNEKNVCIIQSMI